MKILIITHHENSLGYSMMRYTTILMDGLIKRGHNVEIWGPKLYFSKNTPPAGLNKWFRYLDQYVLFPIVFKRKSKALPKETLYVLIDQALGMWMPLIKHKKHVVHCHDFIALKSAFGTIKENPTGWSGKLYQRLILKGLSQANSFISVSKNTQAELLQYLPESPRVNEQVYNALDPVFKPGHPLEARKEIGKYLNHEVANGYILHVGGNTFYKNRVGVLQIYIAWRNMSKMSLPLIMIGSQPTAEMRRIQEASSFKSDMHFIVGLENRLLVRAYQGASVLVFPSLTEGFGFPIAEAMATGCLVITTDEAPMNEVGGFAAIYIKRCPGDQRKTWAQQAAEVLDQTLRLTEKERKVLVDKCLINANRFREDIIVDSIEKIYKEIVYNKVD